MTVHVDTLALSKRLADGGFTPAQSDTLAAALGDAATAADVVTVELFDQRMTLLDQRLIMLEQRLTIRLGGIVVVAVGVIGALLKFIH